MPKGKKRALHPELYEEKSGVFQLPEVAKEVKDNIKSTITPFNEVILTTFALVPAVERGLFQVLRVTIQNGKVINSEFCNEADSRMLCLNTLHHLAVKTYEYPVESDNAAA